MESFVYRIITTVSKEVITCQAAIGTKIINLIRINKPSNLKIVVPAGYIIKSRLGWTKLCTRELKGVKRGSFLSC